MHPSSSFLGQAKDNSTARLPIEELIEKAYKFSRVFPEHKYEIVKKLQERKHICRMTGDGVIDAPTLKKADIGITVADAIDGARGASDIVLTEPHQHQMAYNQQYQVPNQLQIQTPNYQHQTQISYHHQQMQFLSYQPQMQFQRQEETFQQQLQGFTNLLHNGDDPRYGLLKNPASNANQAQSEMESDGEY